MVIARARLYELIAAFVLGGGVVALGYEWNRYTGTALAADPDADGMSSNDEEISDDPDANAWAETSRSVEPQAEGDRPTYLDPDASGSYAAFAPLFADPVAFDEDARRRFPTHGLVTSVAAIVRVRPELEAPILGLLHGGTRVRLDAERTFGGGCSQGWHRVFPSGWICRAAGLAIGDEPPDDGVVNVAPVRLDVELPFDYLRVKDEMTPVFHRLPTYNEQEQADAAAREWFAEHGREPMPLDPSKRPTTVPSVVKEYMNAGFYVTKGGEEVKRERRFVRTMRGAYVRKYQLVPKEAPSFRGRLLTGGEQLPLYFIRRELNLMKREGEGSDVLVETDQAPARLSTYPFARKVHIGTREYFEDENGNLMRAYAVGEAYKLKRPAGVTADEHWVHVDLSEQTLVAYVGDEPVFATLVSSGKEPGMTPVGLHRVQIKHVATPMRDQPQEEEAYSIDDVPWTQYFHGSVALHGAFWHAGFGLVRSHGCINLSPADARWLFGFTHPALPNGWHAYAPLNRGEKGSAIVVTE